MNAGRAYKIFHDLDNDQYTLEEKAVAIYTIMNMATHNSVRKDAFISWYIVMVSRERRPLLLKETQFLACKD